MSTVQNYKNGDFQYVKIQFFLKIKATNIPFSHSVHSHKNHQSLLFILYFNRHSSFFDILYTHLGSVTIICIKILTGLSTSNFQGFLMAPFLTIGHLVEAKSIVLFR